MLLHERTLHLSSKRESQQLSKRPGPAVRAAPAHSSAARRIQSWDSSSVQHPELHGMEQGLQPSAVLSHCCCHAAAVPSGPGTAATAFGSELRWLHRAESARSEHGSVSSPCRQDQSFPHHGLSLAPAFSKASKPFLLSAPLKSINLTFQLYVGLINKDMLPNAAPNDFFFSFF